MQSWAPDTAKRGASSMKSEFTEPEWHRWQGDPGDMIAFAQHVISPTVLRLFYCTCVRRCWALLTDERSRKAVEASENFARGGITAAELLSARKAGYSAFFETASLLGEDSAEANAAAAAFMCANDDLIYANNVPGRAATASGRAADESRWQCDLLRQMVSPIFTAPITKRENGGV